MKQNILKRFFVKPAKKNPDWARIEEPNTIIQPVQVGVIGVVITAFCMLFAYSVMTNSLMEWIAYYLVQLQLNNPLATFTELYAAFTVAIVFFAHLLVTVWFLFFMPASNDDIVEMISDLDSNTQERIVELENTFNEKLDRIINNQ